ncbi:hypothetical protein ACFQ3H_13275, partial [Paralysiella testudinis]|uniref:hypothetical protein n=1 Tax=Paralysiella testudinis TaxID=2809020 RepID=UPI00363C195D
VRTSFYACVSFLFKGMTSNCEQTLIPFVQTLFVWYPSFTKLPPEGRTVSTFLGLVLSVFLITVIWIGLLQLLIFIRRKWSLRKGVS